MDAASILLVVAGALAAFVMLAGGFLLDRRSHRAAAASWMKQWTIRNHALADLYRRWKGPLRLQDHSAGPAPQPLKRKVAPGGRKRSNKG